MSGLLDAAFSKAKDLAVAVAENMNQILSEEDAKLQIITRVFVECLGWSVTDIGSERRVEDGFCDFILSNREAPALVVEAKRVGAIPLGGTATDKVRKLKPNGAGLKPALEGIKQAAGYAAPAGLSVAVLTDGLVWIVFKTFVPGANYRDKQAFVFPSFSSILNDFETFWELLSKTEFQKRTYNRLFDHLHNQRTYLERKLVPAVEEGEVKLDQKSPLAFDLDPVFDKFFSALTGDQDDDFLINCFVETRESRIADFAMEKLTANVLGNLAPAEKDVNAELRTLVESAVDVDGGQTVFVVGPTGAGKTTFLERFFKQTLSTAIRKRCLVCRIDCLNCTGREDTILVWLTEAIIEGLESSLFNDGIPEWGDLQGLYHHEYLRRVKGVDAELYRRDKAAFREKFGRILEKAVETDREGYLRRLLKDVVTNRQLLPIMLLDNTDEFSSDIKRNIFQFAQALRREANHCLLIFPVTDKSAWSFSKTDIYGIYQSRSFYLPTPPPREVFRKRIEFLKAQLSEKWSKDHRKQYFAGKGIRISIKELGAFAEAVESVFVDHEYASKTLGELANYNIRRTLALSKRVITSAVFAIEELLTSFITRKPITPSYIKFMNALMKGDYDHYRQIDAHEIFPVFRIEPSILQSPLLAVRILAFLDLTRISNRDVEDRYLTIESIFGYVEAMGASEVALDTTLLSLLNAGLIEAYDPSVRKLSHGQRVTISFSGRAHLRLAIENEVFFEQMAITTPLANEEVASKIRSLARAKSDLSGRMIQIRRLFSQHLLAEDGSHLMIPPGHAQYSCQAELSEKIDQMAAPPDGGEDYKVPDAPNLGLVASGVIGTVDWYDPEKKFGFVEVDDVDGRVFVHGDRLRNSRLDQLDDGDDILCDVEQGPRGLFVSKIHEIETDPTTVSTATCYVIRVFESRGYGFVRIEGGRDDAFFHYSVVPAGMRNTLAVGATFKAKIGASRNGQGLQVKRILGT